MRAARLIELGLPHYFDRLEAIAIAVLRGDEPAFKYLIPPDAVVPANREYVSTELGSFLWGRSKRATEFYVLKGRDEIRHWRAQKDEAPGHDIAVALRIRRTPGQSWDRLTVGAEAWEPLLRSPLELDWETLAPLNLTPDEVLEKLRLPPPTVSQPSPRGPAHRPVDGRRLGRKRPASRPCSGQFGGPSRRGAPLGRCAAPVAPTPRPPHDRFWLVRTDGSLPAALPEEVRSGFARTVERLAKEALSATLRRPPGGNEVLMALTWCFACCPELVQGRILDALEAQSQDRPHPLLMPPHAIRVLRQGAGRAVTGADRLVRIFA